MALTTAVGLGIQPVAAAPRIHVAIWSRESADALQSKLRYYDARQGIAAVRQSRREALLIRRAPAALGRLQRTLGVQGIVDIDPLTGTPRIVAKLNGFLTGPKRGTARSIGLGYLRTHAAAFGIGVATLRTLSFARDYVSIDGTHHVSWTQSRAGIPVFGSGLKINVSKDGRVINVVGSPVAGLATVGTAASVRSGPAVKTAIRDARLTQVTRLPHVARSGALRIGAPTATKVYFPLHGGVRLAWQTYLVGRQGMYLSVVDARNGRILYRHSLTDSASAQVFENYPNAPYGGVQHRVRLGRYLFASNRLFGNNALVWSDLNDDHRVQRSERIPPNRRGNWDYPFVTFHNSVNSPCPPRFPCSWDSRFRKGEFSWRTNRRQSGTQLFWFLNRYHNHLKQAPIGFTGAAGNFQLFNSTGAGFGGDPVLGQSMDGANTLSLGGPPIGLPDPNHTDNASMSTPPDGFSPTMQMFLWNDPVTNAVLGPRSDPFIQSDGANEADIVFHEYTHGLSNRLVVDASGASTLGNIQAGAMGEAWSDWYAMDFLVNRGLFRDTSADGELRIGPYVGANRNLLRTQPLDCPVGSSSPACRGTPTAGRGGFTYGDFGRVIGTQEVHADGEIWGETLWDLRTALGSSTTEGIVTRAMELSPANPSFLDMRNAILQADMVDNGGANQDAIWHVFANRGMGYFASTINGDDSQPLEDFSMPPAPGSPTGSLSGTVSDADTGLPIRGAVVAFGGHDSGLPGAALVSVTGADGSYFIPGIFTGHYSGVNAVGIGYDRVVSAVTVGQGPNHLSWQLTRDWASSAGGGAIVDFTGPDFTTFGCGPSGAIDQSLGIGWGSTTDTDAGDETGNVTPKFVVVQLPQAVDLSSIAIDPGHTCGDALSASTHDFRIETSTDGVVFQVAATGTYFSDAAGHLNSLSLNPGTTSGIRYIKFWMLDPMVPTTGFVCDNAGDCPSGTGGVAQRCGPAAPDPGNFSGCAFMDMSELEVYGTPSP